MAPARKVTALLLPGGLFVLFGTVVLRPGMLGESVQPYLKIYPYVVFGVGAVLAWYFNRNRVIFALLILGTAAVVLRLIGGDYAAVGSNGRFVFVALTVIVPTNLAAYATLKERGLFTAHGLMRVVAFLVQLLAVDLTIRFEWQTLHEWVGQAVVDERLTSWSNLPQVSLAAFVCAAGFLALHGVLRRDAIEAAFLWALVAAFAAFQGLRWGWLPLPLLATGGLALIWALVETTYRMAYYDELTGLPARRALNEALLRVGNRYAVALVDVDHFKRFNDVFGHEVGDQALRMVAARLSGITGGGKSFRYGGEEFVVLFVRASAAEAVPHLEAARRAIAESTFIVRGSRRPRKKPAAPKRPSGPQVAVSLTISIGLAEPDHRKGKVNPQQVLRAADKALYRAKSAGRNRLMV